MHLYRFRSVLAAIAGVGVFIAVLHTEFLPAWVCMVPLFVAVDGAGVRVAARLGLITGGVISVCGFYWMIGGAETFTGSSVWYGVGVFVLCTLVFSLYWACLVAVYSLKPGALFAACLWVCAEAALQWAAAGMPWFLFRTGNALAGNLSAIQPLSWTGVHGATFVIVFVNCAIARCLVRRAWKSLWRPLCAAVAYLALGWCLVPPPTDSPAFKLAILSEQIPPSVQWDSASGNRLAARLLDLNRVAATHKPDIALWSESAIPWTYRSDDDLVNEILRHSTATHILGMNTAVSENVVHNSAYCLVPAPGATAGGPARYDKQTLLLGIEQPWFGHLIPFASSNGYAVRPGPDAAPLPTPYGPAGIMICNESAVPGAAASPVRQGARFLLNLSNDGWFAGTYLAGLHFYNVRLRAVETRRDIAVNSNLGISGLVRASGRIEEARRSDDPFVSVVRVHPRDGETLAVRLPWLPVALCGLGLLFSLLPYKKPKT